MENGNERSNDGPMEVTGTEEKGLDDSLTSSLQVKNVEKRSDIEDTSAPSADVEQKDKDSEVEPCTSSFMDNTAMTVTPEKLKLGVEKLSLKRF